MERTNLLNGYLGSFKHRIPIDVFKEILKLFKSCYLF
ncbi:MAG: hypothetical protein ACJAQ4_002530 [Cryomorphaceae bacterium]